MNIRLTGSAILVLVELGAAAWHFKPWLDEPPGKEADTSILAPEAPIVMPTNGGQLSVATVTANRIMISSRPNPINTHSGRRR